MAGAFSLLEASSRIVSRLPNPPLRPACELQLAAQLHSLYKALAIYNYGSHPTVAAGNAKFIGKEESINAKIDLSSEEDG
jgi:hypothetical protein